MSVDDIAYINQSPPGNWPPTFHRALAVARSKGHGYTGKREGVGASIRFNYAF